MYTLTRRGIANDLSKSPYWTNINYENFELTFVFSSELNKKRFLKRVEDNRISINMSLSKRFGIEIEACLLSDIKLYTQVEHRGFLIVGKEGEYTWQNIIVLIGEKMIKKN